MTTENASLFPGFDTPPENSCAENACAQTQNKKGGKSGKTTTAKTPTTPKLALTTELETRSFRVKMYQDFYNFEAPEDKEKPTIDDVRLWLVAQGFSELTEERAQFVWIEPKGDGEEKYLYAGVKFEKQG